MNKQIKVSGVILAGGLARRMQKQDKGLILFNEKPMVSYAIQVMHPIVDELFINANRNLEQYEAFNYPVISDQNNDFDGPLAGILAALSHSHADVLLVMPCDSPFITEVCLQALLDEREQQDAEVVVAFDGERTHPVFMALKTSLKDNLVKYLASGERKIDRWFELLHWVAVDFSSTPEIFSNINTLEQLSELAKREVN